MRLLEFYPRGYRNLRDLPLIFTLEDQAPPDTNCSISFLIGLNGTGKSNVLRFLAAIFSALDENFATPRSDNPAYAARFDLIYQLRGNTITITRNNSGREGLTFTIRRSDGVSERIQGDIPERELLLPRTLMIYTSGDINDWRALLMPPAEAEDQGAEDTLPDQLLRDEEEPPNTSLRAGAQDSGEDEPDEAGENEEPSDGSATAGLERVFLVEPKHLPLALLVVLLQHEAWRLDTERGDNTPNGIDFSRVLDHVAIRRLLSCSLRLDLRPRMTAWQRNLLRQLYGLTTLPLKEWDEQLWVFDMDDVRGEALPTQFTKGMITEPFQFFRNLVNLQEAGILQQIHLIIAKQDPLRRDDPERDHALLAASLSDGERAFLERMALIHLLRYNECFFIFDEPEVHFNDNWKRDLVDQIEQTLTNTNSAILLTTHASITVSDAYPEEIVLLSHRGQENVPLTLAAEPGELLRSVFEAEQGVGRRAIRRIEEALRRNEEAELRALLDQVGPSFFRYRVIEAIRSRGGNVPSEKVED